MQYEDIEKVVRAQTEIVEITTGNGFFDKTDTGKAKRFLAALCIELNPQTWQNFIDSEIDWRTFVYNIVWDKWGPYLRDHERHTNGTYGNIIVDMFPSITDAPTTGLQHRLLQITNLLAKTGKDATDYGMTYDTADKLDAEKVKIQLELHKRGVLKL